MYMYVQIDTHIHIEMLFSYYRTETNKTQDNFVQLEENQKDLLHCNAKGKFSPCKRLKGGDLRGLERK